ncbi:Arm DNA-binding domain-containing protein [Mucilaginibacter gilvus]|uniref:Arm DNA-binding domain-containing protein n=1 Tax=Mucilaginibacter gilvus TaxID=2305909 RepID=A0A3S3UIV9_9SPHI|nr:Arm DNA-binding domain-containing protein [Mucilaginibacter gilvus]RWY47355.1 hypothetical protein EPL05_22215 [Mucilaginibacter gilvus]
MRSSNSFSILFWTNKAKADANGLLPLYARVTVEGKRVEISLKRKVNPKKWGAKSGFMVGNGEEVRIINKYINETSNEIFEIYRAFKGHGKPFSAEDIKEKLTGKEQQIVLIFRGC